MKRLLAFALITTMLLVMFAGCSTEEPASSSEPSSEAVGSVPQSEVSAPETNAADAPTKSDAPAEPGEPTAKEEASVYPLGEDIVLTAFCEYRSNDTGGLIETRGDTFAIKYAAEVTGVSLKTTDVSQQTFAENFNLLMVSRDYPDLIFNVNSYYAGGMDAAIEEEVVVDLHPYLEEYAPNYYGLLMENAQSYKDVHTDTGKVGQFFTIENEPQNNGSGYLIRTDMLSQTGMDMPHTIDEYYNVLLAIKDTGFVEYPLYVGSTGIDAISTAYGVGGISVGGGFMGVDINYTVSNGVVSVPYFHDDYATVLEVLKKWLDDGIYSRDFITQSTQTMPPDADYYNAIVNGECALFTYTTNITDLLAEATSKNPDYALEPTTTMVVEEGQILPSSTAVTLVDSNGFAVSTTSKQREIAIRYLDWWYGDEGSLTASYGIEGVTYTIDENGKPQWTDMVMNGDGTYTTNQIVYSYCIQNEMGKIDIHRQDYRKTELSQYINDVWREGIDYEAGEAISRYVTNTAEESERYTSKVNDIATLVAETVPQFILGDLNLTSDLETFRETLISLGIEECIAIKQAVYDRYQSR